MNIEINIPTGKNEYTSLVLKLPVRVSLDEIHDNIDKFVSVDVCVSIEDCAFCDASVSLDGCMSNNVSIENFDVKCELNKKTIALITFY